MKKKYKNKAKNHAMPLTQSRINELKEKYRNPVNIPLKKITKNRSGNKNEQARNDTVEEQGINFPLGYANVHNLDARAR